MATIRERKTADGKIRYHVQVRLKGYPTQTASFARKTDARKWAGDTESAIRQGRHFKHSEAKRHTLGELIDRYIRDVLPGKRATTQAPQRQQLWWWKRELGAYALADITPALLAEYRDRLTREPIPSPAADPEKAGPPRQRTPATVNRYLAVLSHAFTMAVREWGWLEDNPLRKLTKLREARGRVRFLSEGSESPDGTVIEGELTRLLRACRESSNPDLYLAVVLAVSTGARRMEIMGLRWSQVDLHRKAITLHETKNNERRVLPLVGHALELMRQRAKASRIDGELVFPGKNPSKPVDFRTPWETALRCAGVDDFRWHDLRHSCASYLAMNGASLAEIAEVLGHKTLAMVKRYSHLSDHHVAGVVARMNERIFK